MKIISGSKSGNFNLYRRMTQNKNFRSDFLQFQSLVYDMGSKGGNVLSRWIWGDYKEVSSSETIT